MSPSLSQIQLAREDVGLQSRIQLATEKLGRSYPSLTAILPQILAAETTDDGGSPLTIAGAYDYQWMQAIKELAAGGVPTRAQVTHRLAQVGVDPTYITDGTIERAVRAVIPDTPSVPASPQV